MITIQDLMRVWRRPAALAAILALSFALAGCFASRRPLFAEATAVAALGEGGRYVAYEKIGNRFKRDEAIQMRRRDRGYDYINEKGAVTPLTLHPLAKDLFAVQAKSEDGGYLYARLRMRGATGFVEVADCDKQDMKRLAPLGVVKQMSELAKALTGRNDVQTHDCLLDGVQDVGKAFATIRFGTTGKFVPE
jgi:hypothetical protein